MNDRPEWPPSRPPKPDEPTGEGAHPQWPLAPASRPLAVVGAIAVACAYVAAGLLVLGFFIVLATSVGMWGTK